MPSRIVWVVIVIVVALAAAAAGFVGGYEYKTSPASSPSTAANDTLGVLAAGSLAGLFPKVVDDFVNETPNASSPTAAQTYEGSLADFRLIPQLLEPKYASWEVVFGASPEVFVYDPSLPVFANINESNWAEELVQDVHTSGNAPFAVWNASSDPNGYNEIFSLELQGMLYNSSPSTYYSALYSNATGQPAVPNPSLTKIEHESQAATLIDTGVVSALITYRSYAVANGLHYVSMNPIVGLGANNSTALADYAKLSTEIIGSSGSLQSVVPAPVLFAVTVPLNAPNAVLGAEFVRLLLSAQGEAILSEGGAMTPLYPGWVIGTSVPAILTPYVASPPSWAAAFVP